MNGGARGRWEERGSEVEARGERVVNTMYYLLSKRKRKKMI